MKMNSAEFKHFKLHSDSTLKRLTKDELIKEARESNKEIPQRPSKRYYSTNYGNGGRMKKVDIRCPFCSSSFTNGVRTSIGVFATKEKEFIETVDNQNYCWNCGQRLDWSETNDLNPFEDERMYKNGFDEGLEAGFNDGFVEGYADAEKRYEKAYEKVCRQLAEKTIAPKEYWEKWGMEDE